jgi:hypothetical protein
MQTVFSVIPLMKFFDFMMGVQAAAAQLFDHFCLDDTWPPTISFRASNGI